MMYMVVYQSELLQPTFAHTQLHVHSGTLGGSSCLICTGWVFLPGLGQGILRASVQMDCAENQQVTGSHTPLRSLVYWHPWHRRVWDLHGISLALHAHMLQYSWLELSLPPSLSSPFTSLTPSLSLPPSFPLPLSPNSSTHSSNCVSTTRMRSCSSSSITLCSFWSKRSTRQRVLSGHSLTLDLTSSPPSTSLRRWVLCVCVFARTSASLKCANSRDCGDSLYKGVLGSKHASSHTNDDLAG